jgi:hypothetical protein
VSDDQIGPPIVTSTMVEQLALMAELPLPEHRRPAVAEQLNGLLADANLVNRLMEERRHVQPGVRFHHVELEEHGL